MFQGEKVFLTLKSGLAEVFGTELVKGKPCEFTAGAKIAVFTRQVSEHQAASVRSNVTS